MRVPLLSHAAPTRGRWPTSALNRAREPHLGWLSTAAILLVQVLHDGRALVHDGGGLRVAVNQQRELQLAARLRMARTSVPRAACGERKRVSAQEMAHKIGKANER